MLLNFTWWVNRKDEQGNNLFSGGFLGLDNIGIFDRSQPLPTGGSLQQADGTAWMAFYAATMLSMALELAKTDPAYEPGQRGSPAARRDGVERGSRERGGGALPQAEPRSLGAREGSTVGSEMRGE